MLFVLVGELEKKIHRVMNICSSSPWRRASRFGCYLWDGGFITGSQCLPFILLIRECRSFPEKVCLKEADVDVLSFAESQEQAHSYELGRSRSWRAVSATNASSLRQQTDWVVTHCPVTSAPNPAQRHFKSVTSPVPRTCSVFNSC